MGAFATNNGPLPIPEAMMRHLPALASGLPGATSPPAGVGRPRL
jgi:hypothetical protein